MSSNKNSNCKLLFIISNEFFILYTIFQCIRGNSVKATSISILICLIFLSSFAIAQSQKWVSYYNSQYIYAIDEDSNYIWAGADHGLIRITKKTGESKFYDKSDFGLSTNTISAIAIDKRGYLWIGSYYGFIAMFDGEKWTKYDYTNSELHCGYIYTIIVDKDNNKWFGTCMGLVKYDGVNWTYFYSDYSVTSIAIDLKGRVWCGTILNGLVMYDGVNWTSYKTSNSGIPENSVIAVRIDSAGNKWVGTNFGLAKFDDTKWTVYNSYEIQCLDVDLAGNLWFVTSRGNLNKYDGKDFTVCNTPDSVLKYKSVKTIYIDSYRNIWIGTEGLWKYDNSKWASLQISNSKLTSNQTTAVTVDNKNNIWLGNNGIVKIAGSNWTLYNASNSPLPGNDIRVIKVDKYGTKWIGTQYNGLAKFDDVNWTMYNTENSGLPSNKITSLAIDSLGNKWIGTADSGLAKFDGINWKVYNSSNSMMLDNRVSAVEIDPAGNKWICGYSIGLAKFNDTNWTVYAHYNSPIPYSLMNAITIDKKGTKWVGTLQSGILKLEDTIWTVFNALNSKLPSNSIYSISSDKYGNIWAGTFSSGIMKYNGNNWTFYNTENSGLPNNEYIKIAFDHLENTWIGTNDGLSIFNENNVVLSINKTDAPFTEQYTLNQNYPNPFNPSTTIKYDLTKGGLVTLKVFDILGREVALLVNGYQSPGSHSATFNSSGLSSGVYIYTLKAGDNFIQSRKMILVK